MLHNQKESWSVSSMEMETDMQLAFPASFSNFTKGIEHTYP